MAESLATCVYTKPDGSKQAGGEDTNTLFPEGLNLEFCIFAVWLFQELFKSTLKSE